MYMQGYKFLKKVIQLKPDLRSYRTVIPRHHTVCVSSTMMMKMVLLGLWWVLAMKQCAGQIGKSMAIFSTSMSCVCN